MEVSRRNFLKLGVGTVMGSLLISAVPTALKVFADNGASAASQPANMPTNSAHYWRFVVDIRKCIGCGSCVRACKAENDVPLQPEYNRTWVERYVVDAQEKVYVDSPNAGYDGFKAEYMNTKYRTTFFVPKLCNHCDKPPCVPVCPVGATYQNSEGVILINRNACIGCRYCVQACPYGARFFHPTLKVVDKCTWCYHRITKGELPACVETCPTGARMFGDIRDPNSSVSKAIKDEAVGILKPELGNENKVYYLGLDKGVR
jgi:tetrathionate reductase subunit B